MSERLTDAELISLAKLCDMHAANNSWTLGASLRVLSLVEPAVVELRDRRRADLTSDDRDELAVLASALRERVEHQRIITRIDDRHERALAVLDKLLREGQR